MPPPSFDEDDDVVHVRRVPRGASWRDEAEGEAEPEWEWSFPRYTGRHEPMPDSFYDESMSAPPTTHILTEDQEWQRVRIMLQLQDEHLHEEEQEDRDAQVRRHKWMSRGLADQQREAAEGSLMARPTAEAQKQHLHRKMYAKANHTLHRIRAERGVPLHNIGYSRMKSLDIQRRSMAPLCLDELHEPQLTSLRFGNGDLSLGQYCFTCKADRDISEPACFGHLSSIRSLLPVVQDYYLPEYEALVTVACSNCSASLLYTGTVSMSVDRQRNLDPMKSLPLTPKLQQICIRAGIKLPTFPWIPTSVEQVLSWRPQVIAATRELHSRQVEFLMASQYPGVKTHWPKDAKERYNQAFRSFQAARKEVGVWRRRLVLLPCNLVGLYVKHDNYGEHLREELANVSFHRRDLLQRAAEGLLDAHQETEAKAKERVYADHLARLQPKMSDWIRRDRAMKQLMEYLEEYVDIQMRESATDLRPVADWKICRTVPEGTVETHAKVIRDWQTRQWNKRSQQRHEGTKKERADRLKMEMTLAGLAAAEAAAAQEAAAAKDPKATKKKTLSIAAVSAAAAASVKQKAATSADATAASGPVEDIEPNVWNDPTLPRPDVQEDWDRLNPTGHIYCALSAGGCGAHKTQLCSRKMFYWSHYDSECEMWYRLDERDEQLVSSTAIRGILRRMETMPLHLEDKLRHLQQWKYNLQYTVPQSTLFNHIAVVPYPLRRMPTALMQAGKVAKHHLTSCYLSIMSLCQEQFWRRMDFLHTLAYLPIYSTDVDHLDDKARAEARALDEKKADQDGDTVVAATAATTAPKKGRPKGGKRGAAAAVAAAKTEDERWLPDVTIEPLYWLQVRADQRHHDDDDGEVEELRAQTQREAMAAGVLDPFWVAHANAGAQLEWDDDVASCLNVNFMFELVGSLWNVFNFRALRDNKACRVVSKQTALQAKVFELVDISRTTLLPLSEELNLRFGGVLNSHEIFVDVMRCYAELLPVDSALLPPTLPSDDSTSSFAITEAAYAQLPPPPPKKRGRKTKEEEGVEVEWKKKYLAALRRVVSTTACADQTDAQTWMTTYRPSVLSRRRRSTPWTLVEWAQYRHEKQKVRRVWHHCRQFHLTPEARAILQIEIATVEALRARSGRSASSNSTHQEYDSLLQRHAATATKGLKGKGLEGGGGGGGVGIGQQSVLVAQGYIREGTKSKRAARAALLVRSKTTKTARNMVVEDNGVLAEQNKKAVKDSIRAPSISEASIPITHIGIGDEILRQTQERLVVNAHNIDLLQRLICASNDGRNALLQREAHTHEAAALHNEWLLQAMRADPTLKDARLTQASYEGYTYGVAEADRSKRQKVVVAHDDERMEDEGHYHTRTRTKRREEKRAGHEREWNHALDVITQGYEQTDSAYNDIYPAALEIVKTSVVGEGQTKSIDLKWYFRQGRKTPDHFGADKLTIGDVVIRHRKAGDLLMLNRQPSLQIYAILKLIILERKGNAFALNAIVWTVFNGDNDGDAGTGVGDNFNHPMLESLLLMSPVMHFTNVKDGSALFSLMQDSAFGLYSFVTRDFHWTLDRLQDLLASYRRDMRYMQIQHPTQPGRTYQTGDFSATFVARLRTRWMEKVNRLWETEGGLRGGRSPPQWWTTTDPVLVKFLHRPDLYLTQHEIVMCALPPRIHYVRHMDDDSTKPIRVEIKGPDQINGVLIKMDINGHLKALPNHLLYTFGPEAVVEWVENINLASLYLNECLGFSNGQFDCMLTYKTHVELWKLRHKWHRDEAQKHQAWTEKIQIEGQRLTHTLLPPAPMIIQDPASTLAQLQVNADPAVLPLPALAIEPPTEAFSEPGLQGVVRCVPIASSVHQHDYTHMIRTLSEWNDQVQVQEMLMVFDWYRERLKVSDAILKAESRDRAEHYHNLRWEECPFPPGASLWGQCYSGSKGNLGKWFQLLYQPGLQLVEGHLESHDFGNRLLLYLDPEGHWMIHYGMVENSLLYGMEPEEVYLPIAQAQIQNFNSSGQVFETGAAAKMCSRFGRDRVVDAQFGVRDHNGRMIQPFFSSDNMNIAFSHKVECLMDQIFVKEKAMQSVVQSEALVRYHRTWMTPMSQELNEPSLLLSREVDSLSRFTPFLHPLYGGASPPHPPRVNDVQDRVAMHEYVLLLRAFAMRQHAVSRALTKLDLVRDGEVQCVEIPMLCRQIVAGRSSSRGGQGGEDEVLSPWELFEQMTLLRKSLYDECPLWQIEGDPFSAYLPNPQPLDWYIIENLCSARIRDVYHMTKEEVVRLVHWIYDHWVTSRVAVGESVSTLAMQSTFVDQTQGVLNSKHGVMSAMSELTVGPRRFNQVLESTKSIVKDNLLMVDVDVWADAAFRDKVRAQTGVELPAPQKPDDPTHVDPLPFFKQAPLHSYVPTFTVETVDAEVMEELVATCHPFVSVYRHPETMMDNLKPKAEDQTTFMKACVKVIRQTFNSMPAVASTTTRKIVSYEGAPHLQPLNPTQWNPYLQLPSWYIRIVLDTRTCVTHQMDWKAWIRQTRALLSNCFWMFVFHYPDLQMTMVHIFKMHLHGEILSAFFAAKLRSQTYQVQSCIDPLSQCIVPLSKPVVMWETKVWNQKAAEAAALFRSQTVAPSRRGTKRGRQQQPQEQQTATSSSPITTPFPTMYMYESEPLCLLLYVKTVFVRICQPPLVKMLDTERVTAPSSDAPSYAMAALSPSEEPRRHRLTLNIHHKKPNETLAAWYKILMRPDVHPDTAMLIHSNHVDEMYGNIAARNVKTLEFVKAVRGSGCPVDMRHLLQMADSFTANGTLIGLKSKAVSELSDDLMTQVGYRNGFRVLHQSAVLSSRANRRAEALRQFIAVPFISGSEMFKETPEEGGLVAESEASALPPTHSWDNETAA